MNANHTLELNLSMCKRIPASQQRIFPIPIGKMIKELGQKRKRRMSLMEGCPTSYEEQKLEDNET